jgi:N-acetyl-anhydromuramyl-L-alanine amidase AmpD
MSQRRTEALWQSLRSRLPRSPRVRIAMLAAAALLFTTCSLLTGLGGRRGEELRVCGKLAATGTEVVLWDDPGGYDAYQTNKRFSEDPEPDGKLRYGQRDDLPAAIRERVQQGGWRLADLRQVVHTFVLHFDACGTSRQCFKVLQDVRELSVHFLLDTDGTIYQTLDLQERAWHATIANNCSIGIEIANPGCWPRPRHPDMLRWYEKDALGWRMKFPAWMGETGIRTPGFVPRPARPEPVSGIVHATEYWMFDYTPQQYQALAHLCAALHQVFPRIRLEVPRNADGSLRVTQLSAEELRAFDGIVGHSHVQDNKSDPGPAMQWEWLLQEARRIAGE